MLQEYGPGPGGETIEERRLREARELEERERRLREIEEMRNRKVTVLPTLLSGCHHVIISTLSSSRMRTTASATTCSR